MAHLYARGKIIWIKWYESNIKQFQYASTKLPATESGWREARKLKKEVESELIINYRVQKLGTRSLDIPLLSVALTKFMMFKQSSKRKRIALRTVEMYQYALGLWVKFVGDKRVDKYTVEDWDNFEMLMSKDYSINTIGICSRQLNGLFNYCIKKNWRKNNPIERISSEPKEFEPLTEKQLEALFEYCKPFPVQYAIIKLCLYLCGFRIGETIPAQWEDFNIKDGVVHIRNIKGKRIDLIPMLKDAREFMQQNKNRVGRISTYIRHDSINTFWHTMEKEIGFKVNTHQLRKTRCTELANLGVDPYFLKEFMRHKQLETTLKYYTKSNIQKMTSHIDEKLDK